jgi:hypothetical protein
MCLDAITPPARGSKRRCGSRRSGSRRDGVFRAKIDFAHPRLQRHWRGPVIRVCCCCTETRHRRAARRSLHGLRTTSGPHHVHGLSARRPSLSRRHRQDLCRVWSSWLLLPSTPGRIDEPGRNRGRTRRRVTGSPSRVLSDVTARRGLASTPDTSRALRRSCGPADPDQPPAGGDPHETQSTPIPRELREPFSTPETRPRGGGTRVPLAFRSRDRRAGRGPARPDRPRSTPDRSSTYRGGAVRARRGRRAAHTETRSARWRQIGLPSLRSPREPLVPVRRT